MARTIAKSLAALAGNACARRPVDQQGDLLRCALASLPEGVVLIGIDPLLTPGLIHALAAMGHGDTIVLVDANYPATRGRRTLDLAGAGVVEVLRAVLSLLPLDSFVPEPAFVMQVVGDAAAQPPVCAEMNRALAERGYKPAASLERYAFYAAAERAYAIVRTGERRFYGNILLTKGVIPPEQA
jgi:L-fucose mutarotase